MVEMRAVEADPNIEMKNIPLAQDHIGGQADPGHAANRLDATTETIQATEIDIVTEVGTAIRMIGIDVVETVIMIVTDDTGMSDVATEIAAMGDIHHVGTIDTGDLARIDVM
ncbi:hypothetical protein H4219_002406 [Mycoemilia scoparia]|uniref:Uncharacterized protein n=1 Tax=Mycoemilia scoparia TaxID=417184 RepID=A0A9W7ZXJ6_9FUNG|nr:hypothetical protein H4219_002406 [Mycoemilia scoparia]